MKFTIGFEKEDRHQLHKYWDQIIDSETWSWPGSYFEKKFEEDFAEHIGVKHAIAFSSWWGAALAVLSYIKHTYTETSLAYCPSNTFMATPMSLQQSGYEVKFVDCNREDLCMSYDHLSSTSKPESIVFLVHIGGHIAFDAYDIQDLCERNNSILIEDCAHAVGAEWDGEKAGTIGLAGIWSFHATKTISTGEGGMITTNNFELNEYVRKFRDYGKDDYIVKGGNYRMSEFTAAIGCVQVPRINDIVNYKRAMASRWDKIYDHVKLPPGMKSGYYKYIKFNEFDEGDECGSVYDMPCHGIMRTGGYLPNTDWVAKNHQCKGLYYKSEGY